MRDDFSILINKLTYIFIVKQIVLYSSRYSDSNEIKTGLDNVWTGFKPID